MRRYFAGSAALKEDEDEKPAWQEDAPLLSDINVHENEPTPRNTGLLDAQGTPIFALDERLPIGFTHRYAY